MSFALGAMLWPLIPAGLVAQELPPLVKNDFNLDMVVGPVLASGRIVGLGGAYTALATGVDGSPSNPASYASRSLWDLNWFSWELTFNFMTPFTFAENDFDNNGQEGFRYRNFLFLTPGFRMQWGDFGLGAVAHAQIYTIRPPDETRGATQVQTLVGNYGFGYMLLDGQVVMGVGLRTASLTVRAPDENGITTDLAHLTGTGTEIGLLVKPAGHQFRFGVAARRPVTGLVDEGMSDTTGVRRAAGFVLPRDVRMPWQLQVGAAYQFGKRPMNERWNNPRKLEQRLRLEMMARRWRRYNEQARHERKATEREQSGDETQRRIVQNTKPPGRAPVERFFDHNPQLLGVAGEPLVWGNRGPQDGEWWREEREVRREEEEEIERELARDKDRHRARIRGLSRDYLLVSGEMIVTGATANGVGLEGFLSRRREVSGQAASFGFRCGIEGEPIARTLKMRAGVYLEPSRFEGVGYRPHFTTGFDLRLFEWDLFGWLWKFDVRLGGTVDLAPRYRTYGLGIGFWH